MQAATIGFRWAVFALLLMVAAQAPALATGARLYLSVSFVTVSGLPLSDHAFDLDQLDLLPQDRIITATPWTHGPQSFTGPPLATLAGLEANRGRRVRAVRVSSWADWTVTIPASDWERLNVILATRLNGQTMRVRDKGPYWIMYPIGDTRDVDMQMYQARMMWQVKSLEFVVE